MFHDMNILDQTGHTKISWDPAVEHEVEAAEEHFDLLIARGYNAFRVEGEDRQGARLTRFDPKAREIMMIPQLQGG
jgi:hypothetical protein